MSVAHTVVQQFSHFAASLPGQAVPNPKATAIPGAEGPVNTVLGYIKWGSVMICVAVLFGAGAVLLAGERGHGSGISPEIKKLLGGVFIVLIIISAASGAVQSLSA